jgi:hypothetical protein
MSHASGVCRVNSSCARSLFMNPRVRGLLKWKTFPMEWIIIIIYYSSTVTLNSSLFTLVKNSNFNVLMILAEENLNKLNYKLNYPSLYKSNKN